MRVVVYGRVFLGDLGVVRVRVEEVRVKTAIIRVKTGKVRCFLESFSAFLYVRS
jgi:hypothetical protein